MKFRKYKKVQNMELNDLVETPDDYELMDIDMEEVQRISRKSQEDVAKMFEEQKKNYNYDLVSTYNISMWEILKMILMKIMSKIKKN